MKTNFKKLRPFSRSLRSNMTPAEKRLWEKIRRKQLNGLMFHRQQIIGNCIADFYCPQAKLVIEVDGKQHYTEPGMEYDEIRDDFMNNLGIKVLRFSNDKVLNDTDAVVDEIRKCL